MAVLLNGCMPIWEYYEEDKRTPKVNPQYPAFNEQEYSAFEGTGTATITGRVISHPRGKPPDPMPQRLVILDPVTEYSALWWACVGMFNESPLTSHPPDPRFLRFRRQTVTGPHGEFSFTELPPGKYTVLSTADWLEEPPPKKGKIIDSGSKAGDSVEAFADQTVSIDLCNGFHCDRQSYPMRTDVRRPQECYPKVRPPCSFWQSMTRGCP